MPGHTCIVYGNTSSQDANMSFHRFPSDPDQRASWLQAFGLDESQLKSQSQVCCRHVRDGNAKNEPLPSYASPIKGKQPRAKGPKTRERAKELTDLGLRSSWSPACLSRLVTLSEISPSPIPHKSPLTVSAGEQWETNYQVHELPGGNSDAGATHRQQHHKKRRGAC